MTIGDVSSWYAELWLEKLLKRTQTEAQEWREDAERLIQLANLNNKKAIEYLDLHEQLMARYETGKVMEAIQFQDDKTSSDNNKGE